MTTLNARANQAYREYVQNQDPDLRFFLGEQHAFEEGWETGYKTAAEETRFEIERLTATIHEVARMLRDEAFETVDGNTTAKLKRIARDLVGGEE